MPRKTSSNSILTFLFFSLIGVAFFVLWGKQFDFDSNPEKGADVAVVQEQTVVFSLTPITVALAGRYLKVETNESEARPKIGTGKKYLKMAVDLEIKNNGVQEDLEKQLPQIRDTISAIASGKHVKDIETVEGKGVFQAEIAGKINGIFQKEAVSNVFFREFVIQ